MTSRPPDRSACGVERVKVKSRKPRKVSSRAWLERQLNDPYVSAAKKEGYRSRAAFKLLELDRKFHFLKKARACSISAQHPAAGARSRISARARAARWWAPTFSRSRRSPGVTLLQCDLLDARTPALLKDALGAPADVVLTDMAARRRAIGPPTICAPRRCSRPRSTSRKTCSSPAASSSARCSQGGAAGALLARVKSLFREVKHVKPPASRAESVELYLVATGFRG